MKIRLKSGYELNVLDAAESSFFASIVSNETEALSLCGEITDDAVSVIQFMEGEETVNKLDNVVIIEPPKRQTLHDGTVKVEIYLRQMSEEEIREKKTEAFAKEMAEKIMDDAEAEAVQFLFDEWSGNGVSYTKDQYRSYNGALYKCLKGHTSQADWNPESAVSLWAKVLVPQDEDGNQTAVAEWVQPDSTNPYKKGDKVRFEGKTYESLIDGNVWSPTAYPAGWKEVEM